MLYFRAIFRIKLAGGDDMFDKCGSRIAGILSENRIIREEDREIIVYGLDALLSTLANLVIIIVIGILLGQFVQTVVFLVSFAALRVFAGGYHARTRIGCTATFIIIYLAGMALQQYTPNMLIKPAAVCLALASLVSVLVLAPIEHPNRPFQDNEYQVFKTASRVVAGLETLLVVLGISFTGYVNLAYCISLAMLGVTIVLILARKFGKRSE